MYLSDTSLPPALLPHAYHDPAIAAAEREHVLAPAWHPVATTGQLAEPGQFITAQLLGVPLVVRRFGVDETTTVALRNVCAHRHCTIVEAAAGTAEKLRCPYHGWEYGADGLTRRIPKAKNFPHFDRDAHQLDRFAVDRCGEVVFVQLAEGPSLREWLGEYAAVLEERTAAPLYRVTMARTLPCEANWKIPLEGSLESYHLPDVHAATFGPDSDPGEEHSHHRIEPGFTSFWTTHRQPSLITRAEDWAQRRLGIAQPDGRYEHHHLFPNLMIAVTGSITLLTCVVPTSPTTSELRCWQWGRQSTGRRLRDRVVGRTTAYWLGRSASAASLKVVEEDVAIFPRVQRGIEGAGAAGRLGRCEERLHAFQSFVAERLGDAIDAAATPDAFAAAAAKPPHETTATDSITSNDSITVNETTATTAPA